MKTLENYIHHLLDLVEMEREAEISAMMSEIRRFSPGKRESVGRAINHLNGKLMGKELGFNMIKYGRKKSFETEINVGDLVLLSKGDPLRSKLTGTVAEKGKRFLVLAMENIPKWALKDVRIDLYANDITFRRMRENLEKLSPYAVNALEYLLKIKSPSSLDKSESFNFNKNLNENSNSNKNKFNNNKFTIGDLELNGSQKEAISLALNSEDFFLIHGPFGTGKTRTLLELIKQEVKRGHKVLATAESNAAVDNILEGLVDDSDCVRLGHPQRVSRKNIEHTLAYKVENHALQSKISSLRKNITKMILERDKHHKPSPGFRRGLSDTQILINAVKRKGSRGVSPNVMISMAGWIEKNQNIDKIHENIQEIETQIINNILRKSQIILCTNSSAGLEYLKGIKFDLAVVDESSQTTIPSALIPISKAPRFILAGDHRQLPPTILNQKARELEKTLFEELIKLYPSHSHMLNFQYRMNPVLMEFPNQEFYNGKLRAAHEVGDININDLDIENSSEIPQHLENQLKYIYKSLMDPYHPFIFLDTSRIKHNSEKRLKGSTSIQNPLEADFVAIISNLLQKSGISGEDIGIISPYEDQVDLISSLTKIEVSTVDGFQGREKEIIIISLVRSNPKNKIGFLNDLRRLNVALTRARRKLIVVGDSATLKNHPTYHHLIQYAETNGFLENGENWLEK